MVISVKSSKILTCLDLHHTASLGQRVRRMFISTWRLGTFSCLSKSFLKIKKKKYMLFQRQTLERLSGEKKCLKATPCVQAMYFWLRDSGAMSHRSQDEWDCFSLLLCLWLQLLLIISPSALIRFGVDWGNKGWAEKGVITENDEKKLLFFSAHTPNQSTFLMI